MDTYSQLDKAVFSPRANIPFNPIEDINLRFSYAEGFCALQAFDDDLHPSNLAGDLIAIQRSPDLVEERSRSVNGSVDFYRYTGDFQFNLLWEGFYTKLNNPFVLSAPVKADNGYLIQTRINGSGAKVYGTTLEGKVAWRNKVQFQAGVTFQRSRYDDAEEWSADDEHLTDDERRCKRMLRTPDVYGYFTASYTPIKPLTFSLNGNYTGSMYVPHLLSEVNGEADQLVKTSDFFELGARVNYDLKISAGITLQLNAGVQNIFNAYQKDFDQGATRDSGYIYGPGAPRTYYAGAQVRF